MVVEFHVEKATYFFETMIHVFQKTFREPRGGILGHIFFRFFTRP